MSGSNEEIWFLNRGLVVLRPKEHFVTWVREADPGDTPLDDETVRQHASAFLIPQLDSDEDSWAWVRANSEFLFEFSLNEWYTDESMWPGDRSWESFQEWFHVEFIDLVWDLVADRLTSDPNAPEHQQY